MTAYTERKSRICGFVAVMLSVLGVPELVYADGYNDWAGAVAGPGELYVVPAVQVAVSPGASAYWQAQFQIGLTEKTDFIITAATTQDASGWLHDGLYLQPRYALAEQLSVSIGWFVPGNVEADRLAIQPGVFHTIELSGGRYKINWNAVFSIPLMGNNPLSVFAPFVAQRSVSDSLSVFVEADLYGPVNQPTDMSIDVLAGVEWALSDSHTVNVSAMVPSVPDFDPAAFGIGVWWSIGAQIPPFR